MMYSRAEAGRRSGAHDLGNEKLLREIDAINKAIYPDRSRPRSSVSTLSSRSKSVGKTNVPDPKSKYRPANEEPPNKDKKSFWNWKPLKALSHIRNRRFNCCFTLQVHSVEGLPPAFNDVSVRVHWKRRDGELVTHPVRVFQGVAEFEEQLMHVCSVYGSRSGPHHSAKYEAKHFLLYASILGSPQLDLGKHRVDLTRLLPLTLEELEEEKSSAKWTTSFKLSGKARGAVMNVSFGYSVINDNAVGRATLTNTHEAVRLKHNSASVSNSMIKCNKGGGKSVIHGAESLPSHPIQKSHGISPQPVEKVKVLHEVLPISKSELSSSVNMLYRKLNEERLDASEREEPKADVLTEYVETSKPISDPLTDLGKGTAENGIEDNEFSIVEHGIELPLNEQMESTEVAREAADDPVAEHGIQFPSNELVKSDEGTIIGPGEGSSVECVDLVETDVNFVGGLENETEVLPQAEVNREHVDELAVPQSSSKDDICTKEGLMEELESALDLVSNLEVAGLESPEDQKTYLGNKSSFRMNRRKSHSLDDVTESVACEFLDMIGIEHSPFGMSSESEPESPRERLLRQFEKDALASGCDLFNFCLDDADQVELGQNDSTSSGWGNFHEDFDLSSDFQPAAGEHQPAGHKTRAKMLENLETEELMREWGLNERAFEGSPPNSSGGFGSPIHVTPEDPIQRPPLGDGLGPFVQTKNGGFLRSMNPALFSIAKSGGSLIMQVSSPVVVPAEMGSGIVEILQSLASIGIERLSMQANKLMPLDDINGSTMQQIAWDTAPHLEAPERQAFMNNDSEFGQDLLSGQKKARGKSSQRRSSNFDTNLEAKEMDSEYVSLEELAPLAMDKIEALSIEGLRIQSGMSDEEAPSNISSQFIGDISALEGKRANLGGSLGMEGAAGLQLLDIKEGYDGDSGDGLMSLSLTLDEWMRLDSGEIEDEDQIDERTAKILAAHHANRTDFSHRGLKGEKRRGKGSKRKCGLLGNNFTVALMVQLRDPLRNYEPVGAPMLSLIQVERVFVPPKPKIYCTVSEVTNANEEDDEPELATVIEKKETQKEQILEEEALPQFKITEVHVAGLKTEPKKKKLWGNTAQQQSGSRWLVANGMGKSNKHPFMKSKAVGKSTPTASAAATAKVQQGDNLWSISGRFKGAESKWRESASLNTHVRNPNVVFPDRTIRLS